MIGEESAKKEATEKKSREHVWEVESNLGHKITICRSWQAFVATRDEPKDRGS